jgi:hypothetical protein
MDIIHKDSYLEIQYSELRQENQVNILMTSEYPISISNIAVFHKTGQGKPSLSDDSINYGFRAYISFLVIYILLMIYLAYVDLVLKPELSYLSLDSYLRKRKPILQRSKNWKSNRTYHIEAKLLRTCSYETNLEDTLLYKALNGDLDRFLFEDEIEHFYQTAHKQFYLLAIEKLYRNWGHIDCLAKVMDFEKPQNMNDKKWNELIEDYSKQYVTCFLDNLTDRYNLSNYSKIKDAIKPTWLPKKYWERISDYIKEHYYYLIVHNISSSFGQIVDKKDFLDAVDADLLSDDRLTKIESILDKSNENNMSIPLGVDDAKRFLETPRPDWLSDRMYLPLKRLSESLIENQETRQEISKQRESLSKEFGDKIEKCEQDRKEYAELKDSLEDLKVKLTSQMEIIANLFKDPDSINRIEDYNNPFAEGNFEVLKRLSEKLKEIT